jgi:transcriptional regulator with XRE-family HTH domain
MHIGEKIKHFRELRNFDQKHMAKQLDISQSTYSKIENGHDLAYSQLEKIAEVLEVKVQELVGFEPAQYINNVYNNHNSQIGNNLYHNNVVQKLEALEERVSSLEQQTKNGPHQ